MTEAKSLFEKTSIFNPEGIALPNECFVLVHSGRKFMMPAEIKNLAAATEYARRRLQTSRSQLQQGKAEECAKILIEIAVTVVTPMTVD